MNVKKLKAVAALALSLTLAAPVGIPLTTPVTTVQAAAKVKLNAAKKTVNVGKTIRLRLTGTKKKVTWKTSKKTVATVSKSGVVSAVASGKAVITATCDKKTYKCTVTVKNPKLKKAYADKKAGNFNFVYPKGWVTTAQSANGSFMFSAANSKTAPTKGIAVVCVPTGAEAIPYDVLKETTAPTYTEDYFKAAAEANGATDVSVTDLKITDFKSTKGMCLQITYHMKATVNGVTEEGNYTTFLLSIDNYLIETDGIIDTENPDEYLMDETIAAVNGFTVLK